MTRSLRIVVGEDEATTLEYLQEILPTLGHEVVGVASTGRDLVERCRRDAPDLVVTDIRMPELDGIDAAVQIYQDKPIPVILISGFVDPEFISRAEHHHILGYLIKPIKRAELEAAIAIAMRRFEEFEKLRKEASDLRQALADRKVIERAKGVLMKKAKLDEQEAFRRLQRLARETNRKLAEIAQMILLTDQAISPDAT